MNLSDLNPELRGANNVLLFDCPVHREHRIRVPLDGAQPNQNGCVWRATGEFPKLSLLPSVNVGDCGHFVIAHGVLAFV